MSNLTKRDIAEKLVKHIGFRYTEAMSIVNSFFDEIKQSLAKGDTVKLFGFGNFILRDKNARMGRNPKTGEPFSISRRRVVVFKSGVKLKKIVQASSLLDQDAKRQSDSE